MEQAHAGRGAAVAAGKPAAWDLYFDQKDFDIQDRRAQLVAELAAFFASGAGWHLLLSASSWFQRVVVELDCLELAQLCRSQDLCEALEHAPAEALDCIAVAAYEVSSPI